MNHQSDRPVVLVTGCSSGIGRATVMRLVERGFQPIAGVRKRADLENLSAASDQIIPLQIDVEDSQSIATAVGDIRSRFPNGIDGLVNNAGIAVAGPLELVTRDQWQRQFDVNVLGMMDMIHQFLPMMRGRKSRIINISSAAVNLALPMLGAYASSKCAVEALSDSLRRELWSAGTKVIVIRPGQTATPIFEKTERETETHMDTMDEDAVNAYRRSLTRLQELMHRSERFRSSPNRVAAVVVRALSARYPKRRYHVGWDTNASRWVARYVPDLLVDRVIAWKLRSQRAERNGH
ncbi:MAG: SDR family oxidoreductase [Planctomycetota bacterium]